MARHMTSFLVLFASKEQAATAEEAQASPAVKDKSHWRSRGKKRT